MKKLVEQLRNETKELKATFLKRNEEWANEEYDRLRKFADDYFYSRLPRTGENEKKYWRLPACIINSNGNREEYLARERKEAENKYENSLLKLADRITKKGLNTANLRMVTEAEMDKGNISTTITDGATTVTAYTILAWGDIYRPHYRYLVK